MFSFGGGTISHNLESGTPNTTTSAIKPHQNSSNLFFFLFGRRVALLRLDGRRKLRRPLLRSHHGVRPRRAKIQNSKFEFAMTTQMSLIKLKVKDPTRVRLARGYDGGGAARVLRRAALTPLFRSVLEVFR